MKEIFSEPIEIDGKIGDVLIGGKDNVDSKADSKSISDVDSVTRLAELIASHVDPYTLKSIKRSDS